MKKILLFAAAAALSMSASADVIWEGTVSTGSWGSEEGVSCIKLANASFATASLDDKLVFTVSEVAAGTEYPKFLVKNGGDWSDLVNCEVTVTEAGEYTWAIADEGNLAVLKEKGAIIQGDGVTITKIELSSSTVFEYTKVWEGEGNLDWTFAEGMPQVENPVLVDLKEGDIIAFTLTAIAPADSWPKVCVRDLKDTDIATLELWNFIGEPFPMVKNLVVDDPAKFKEGFKCVGPAGTTVTKIEVGIKQGSQSVDDGIVVLWEGEPYAINWGGGPEVSATKGEKVNVGDELILTVTDFGTADWTKVCLQDLSDYDEIYTFELWTPRADNAALPYEAKVTVDETIKAGLAKGFRMVGDSDGAVVTKLVAKSEKSSVESVISADADAPVEYFNLQGVRVQNPENGLYIMRQGKKVSKVYVK